MNTKYEINEHQEVVPYTDGRMCLDTRAWREATDLEIQQQQEITDLRAKIEELETELDELKNP